MRRYEIAKNNSVQVMPVRASSVYIYLVTKPQPDTSSDSRSHKKGQVSYEHSWETISLPKVRARFVLNHDVPKPQA